MTGDVSRPGPNKLQAPVKRKKTRHLPRWVMLLVALVLIGDFAILRQYGDALQSTNLFIVRSTVFYPVAWLNLIAGMSLVVVVLWEWLIRKRG